MSKKENPTECMDTGITLSALVDIMTDRREMASKIILDHFQPLSLSFWSLSTTSHQQFQGQLIHISNTQSWSKLFFCLKQSTVFW